MKTQSITALCSLLFAATSALAQDRPAVVEFQTNLGTIAIELDYAKAPVSSDNFVAYATSGFYKNTLVHRVVKDFVIQGGGVGRDGKFKTANAPIVLESTNITGLSNLAGTVAMARTSVANSATSQYFINLANNTQLNYADAQHPGYAVFGEVVRGMPIVTDIGILPTWSELPFSGDTTMAGVWVEAVYTTAAWDDGISRTRITRLGSGTVTSDPLGISCGASCTISQPEGELLSLKAEPAKNFGFAGWRGDCKGLRRTIKIDTTTGNHNCTAIFMRQGPFTQ